MSVETALAAGRRAAESRMTSRVTVGRKTGQRVTLPSGAKVDQWAIVHATSPARLAGARNGQSQSRTEVAGSTEIQLGIRTLHLPIAIDDVLDGDLVAITSGERAGTWWRVVEGDLADQQTATRLPVVAAQKPEGWPT